MNNKPRGWANLQQQLKEVREESFKQGIWKGKEEVRKELQSKIIKEINRLEESIGQLNCDENCVGIIWDIEFEKLKQNLNKLFKNGN